MFSNISYLINTILTFLSNLTGSNPYENNSRVASYSSRSGSPTAANAPFDNQSYISNTKSQRITQVSLNSQNKTLITHFQNVQQSIPVSSNSNVSTVTMTPTPVPVKDSKRKLSFSLIKKPQLQTSQLQVSAIALAQPQSVSISNSNQMTWSSSKTQTGSRLPPPNSVNLNNSTTTNNPAVTDNSNNKSAK